MSFLPHLKPSLLGVGLTLWLLALFLLLFPSPLAAQLDTAVSPLDQLPPNKLYQKYPDLLHWQKPPGKPKVAIQIGHWQTASAPGEIDHIRENGGTAGGGTTEVAVNLAIAEALKTQLETKGFSVNLLPVTIPPGYYADVFVAVHADGSKDSAKRGFKVSPPAFDFSGSSQALAQAITTTYTNTTGLPQDPEITDNMRLYYAFSWWKNDHALHPMTPAVIMETGFLTNRSDRIFIVDQPELVAHALAAGIENYLANRQ